MDWVTFAIVVTALATLVTAGTAVGVIIISRSQVAISQRQVEASQEQARLASETLRDLHRPIICPSGTLPGTEGNLDWNRAEYEVLLQNVDSGIALNICGVMLPPKSAIPQYMLEPRYTLWRLPNLPTNTPSQPFKLLKGVVTISGNSTIDKENQRSLFAPSKPSDLDLRVGTAYNIIARLTLTYQDIFGFKHAGIFDYIDLYGWQHVASIPNISVELEDLQHQREAEQQRQQQVLSRLTLKRITGG